MPQSRQKHEDAKVEDATPLPFAVSAKRTKNIIPEPGSERDVPALPHIADRLTQIWPAEVRHKRETHHSCTSDSNHAIPSEVAVQLYGKEPRRTPKCERFAFMLMRIVEYIYNVSAKP